MQKRPCACLGAQDRTECDPDRESGSRCRCIGDHRTQPLHSSDELLSPTLSLWAAGRSQLSHDFCHGERKVWTALMLVVVHMRLLRRYRGREAHWQSWRGLDILPPVRSDRTAPLPRPCIVIPACGSTHCVCSSPPESNSSDTPVSTIPGTLSFSSRRRMLWKALFHSHPVNPNPPHSQDRGLHGIMLYATASPPHHTLSTELISQGH
ncbi:hypothetical protein OH77DRAFT_617801 [Trametes cingulata]|nr:hypothetical protein OH77DRAFT_617801 [Trametes cingulata]